MSQESGVNVSLRYVREATRGVTPAGVGTPVVCGLDQTGVGIALLTRAAGSFTTDGFKAQQTVKLVGFTAANNNGLFRIQSVDSATQCTLEDSGDVITTEVAGVATAQIALQELRATTRAINLEKNMLETAEVRADRQKSDVRHGFNRVVGAPGGELSLKSLDDILEIALARAWVAVTQVSGTNLSINSGTKILGRAAGSFITDGYRAGDIVRVAGFANGANNTDFLVLTVVALSLTLSDPSNVIVTEAAGAARTVTYPGKRLDIGSVLSTLTVERAFAGVTKYQAFKGVAIDKMSLSIKPESIVGGTFDMIGMSAAAMSNSPLSSVDPVARQTTTPLASFEGALYEGGVLAAVVTSLDLALNNNRQLAAVIGSKYSPDVYEGVLDLTGAIVAFFEDATLLNKFINETESKLYVKCQDPVTATDFISFTFPRVKYTGGMIDPPQVGPVPVNMPWRALVQSGLAVSGGTTLASCLTIQRSNQYSS